MVDAEVERRSALPPIDDPDNPLFPISPEVVLSIIRKLKSRKAPGLDGITKKVINLFSAPLIIIMTAIFNTVLSNNLFPQSWKEATDIGFHQPGNPKAETSSYRPINLLNTFGKIH